MSYYKSQGVTNLILGIGLGIVNAGIAVINYSYGTYWLLPFNAIGVIAAGVLISVEFKWLKMDKEIRS